MTAIGDILSAVVTMLNAATFTPAVTAVKAYLPRKDLVDAATLSMQVFPDAQTEARVTRGNTRQVERTIGIAIVQRLTGSDDNADCDTLMSLAEQVSDAVWSTALAALPGVHCMAVAREPLIVPSDLEELRQVVTVLKVTYLSHED